MRTKTFFITAILICVLFTAACKGRSKDGKTGIAVFVPGVLEGSPTYMMMDVGVRKAAEANGIAVKTMEGGFDQAAWATQITALAAAGRYRLIVTSNAAMSEICAVAAETYTEQDFLVLDGSGLGGTMVSEVIYDHLEQAFLAGYFSGLITTSADLDGANEALKVGMIVGQEYPQMNKQIRPGFEIGLHTVNPNMKLEFRVLGNWYDAEKAREYAGGLIAEGIDVILTIAGGANEGVIAAAKENGKYVLWFDSDGTGIAPGTVIGSAVLHQDRAAEDWTNAWIAGELKKGEKTTLGVKENYIDFPLDIKTMRRHVPESIRLQTEEILDDMRQGVLNLRDLEY